MSSHGLARPDRASLAGGIVTDGKDEVDGWSSDPRKLLPTLAAQAFQGYVGNLQLPEGFRPYCTRSVAAGAVGGEARPAFVIQDGLSHDRASRIPGTKKQDVIVSLHRRSPCLRRLLSIAAGWSAARLWLTGADEGTHEFPVHLRGDLFRVHALFMEKRACVLHAIDSRGFNFNLFEACSRQLVAIFVLFQCSGNATHPQQHALAEFRIDRAARHDIGHRKSPSWLEHAEGLAQNLILVCGEIDDTVGDDNVHGIAGQGNMFDLAL